MLEQETASIIKFILDSAGNPYPYYNKIKENFLVPAIYFPPPEADTAGETFRSYCVTFLWNIKCIHRTTEEAYQLAISALLAIKKARHLIPLIDENGELAGGYVRVNDPSIEQGDTGVYHIKLEWNSRRPYDAEESPSADEIKYNIRSKS